MEALTPRGKKLVRLEGVAEIEYGCAIDIVAERLAGVAPGETIPPGFRADAMRALIAAGAESLGIASAANARAQGMRERE